MTAYNVIDNYGSDTPLREYEFYELINEFQRSFLKEIDYHERLSYTREPIAYVSGVLRDVQELDLKIQYRPEMRHHDAIKNSSGYVTTEVTQIWRDDNRLKSLYNCTIRYCILNRKDFIPIAVHVAEFRAMVKLGRKLRIALRKLQPVIVEPSPNQSKSVKNKRATIPRKVLVRLLKEVDNKCPFCGYDDPAHLEIHHIDDDRTHRNPERLIMVCPTCHTKVSNNEITRRLVESKKEELVNKISVSPSLKSKIDVKTKVANISTGNNSTIIVKQAKAVIQKYPQGCIGYETEKANYISYLISRYHEFKEWEVGKVKMNYAIFNSHLKKQFKIGKQRTISHLPSDQFEVLAKYIQDRIDNTKLGKSKGTNMPNYSAFPINTS